MKQKMVSLTDQQKTTSPEPKQQISVPQKVTPHGAKDSGVKSTNSKKRSRGKKGAAKQTPDDPNKKTPYQGNNRACGLFHCRDCKKGWFSPHTWANRYQKCKGCNAEIYPHIQFRPEKAKGPKKTTPPHPKDLCEMCMKLGYPCTDRKVPAKKAAKPQREE